MRKLLLIAILLLIATGCGAVVTTVEEHEIHQTIEYTTEEPQQENVANEGVNEIEILREPEEALPTVEPELFTEETPEPTPLLITEEGIVWIVPPIFEYDHISYCSQCGFIDSQRRIINPATGEWEGWGGHGGGDWFSGFVYDLEYHLFGMPRLSYEYDGMSIGMHPISEYLTLFGSPGLVIVQAVDSTNRVYWDSRVYWIFGDETELLGQAWNLTDDAFLGVFAVMYNGEFITDFIFDDGFVWWEYYRGEHIAGVVAMSLDGVWGTIDRYGNVSIPFIFNHMSYFDRSRALAIYEGKQGLIDRHGNVLVPFLFDEIYHFGPGWQTSWLAAISNGRHGLIDESGNTVIPFLFDHLFDICGNTAFAKYYGLYGIIDIHQTIKHTAQQ